MAALRQGKNLRRLLCRSRLVPEPSNRPVRSSRTAVGWKPCSGYTKMCPICPFVAAPTSEIVNDLNEFVASSDLIIANRLTEELEHVENKVYSRDVFQEN